MTIDELEELLRMAMAAHRTAREKISKLEADLIIERQMVKNFMEETNDE